MIKNCYVYFITEVHTNRLRGKSAVKIGIALNPERRVKELQTGNARQLEVTITIGPMSEKTAANLERNLHRRFKRLRLKGEWFEPDVVRRLQNNTDWEYDGDVKIYDSEFMSSNRRIEGAKERNNANEALDMKLLNEHRHLNDL